MALAQTKVRVFAFNRSTAAPVLSDAANITAKWAKDYSTPTALTDVNPVEAEDGFYYFDLSSGERAVTIIGEIFPESSTSGVQVIGVPAYFMASGGAAGSGSTEETLTITVGGQPADGVAVWVTTDIGGTNVVAGTSWTDAFGEVTFMLDSGGDYYCWKQKAGVNFTNPEAFTVA